MKNEEMNLMDDDMFQIEDDATVKESASTDDTVQIDEGLIDSFAGEEELDPNEEKLKEMNKKLPKWSLEPPQGFLK